MASKMPTSTVCTPCCMFIAVVLPTTNERSLTWITDADPAPFAYNFLQHAPVDHAQDQPHVPLMDQNQQSFMDNFWDHPDAAIANDEIVPLHLRGFGINEKGGDTNMSALGLPFSNAMSATNPRVSGSTHMPAAQVPRTTNHMAMPHLSQNDVSGGFETFLHDYGRNLDPYSQQSLNHDNQAVSALLSMSSDSQEHSQPAVASELSGSSWGNLNMVNPNGYSSDQLGSPAVSGNPSSGSTTTPLTPTAKQQYHRAGRASSHSQFQHHDAASHVSHPSNFAHTRHQSMQLGNSGSRMFNSHSQQWQLPQAAVGLSFSQHRAPTLQYGTDQNFSQQGYQASGFSMAEDKSNNLLNVPWAGQVAQTPHASVAADEQVTGMSGTGHQQRHSVPNNLQQLSNAALSQYTSPTTPQSTNQILPMHTMEGLDDAQQSRKRRRSQVEGESQGAQELSQTSALVASRDSITLDREVTNDHSQDTFATPPGSSKRRRSNARPGTASTTASASPSTPAPATIKRSSSSKKRRSESKPTRNNLSDTQKRNNHIASEQKRRDAMKTNYDELNMFVPSLRGGSHGLSRSEVLQHASDWLQSLTLGNQALMAAYGISFDDLEDEDTDAEN